MSRLDEALKRAQGGAGADATGAHAGGAGLERFPASAGTGSEEGVPEASGAADRSSESAPQRPTAPVVRPIREQRPSGQSKWLRLLEPKLVVSSEPHPIAIEQYRRLAGILHHAQRDRGVKVVMVASAVPGEGKTLTSTNLALTLSESYHRRVLLMDADLRRPTMHRLIGLANTAGLTDVLRATDERKPSVSLVSECLTVLPAGEPDPDPMSGLTSDRMRAIVREASERFDWVIIDTPPLTMLPDAALLAGMIDVAVLVIKAGETPFQLVQQAIDALGRERVIGVVLNRVDERDMPTEYAAGRYYSHRA
jgi:protein-tyrosine kinase